MFTEKSPESNIIKVHCNGTCEWHSLFDLSESHCPIDVTWFPFDTQSCKLEYELYRYPSTEVNMTAASVVLDEYQRSDQWKLLGSYTQQYYDGWIRIFQMSYVTSDKSEKIFKLVDNEHDH